MLRADEARCLGLLPGPDIEIPCTKREACARYRQRYYGGAGVQTWQWLCPTTEDYYGRWVEHKEQE